MAHSEDELGVAAFLACLLSKKRFIF